MDKGHQIQILATAVQELGELPIKVKQSEYCLTIMKRIEVVAGELGKELQAERQQEEKRKTRKQKTKKRVVEQDSKTNGHDLEVTSSV